MYLALFVIYAIIAAVTANPIYVNDCGVLDTPLATYRLANDIMISNLSYGYVCLNIKGNGITLDGNGFQLSSASGSLLPGTGVQYSGTRATVTNLHVSNLRTAIHANGKFGKVHGNTITRAVNGIDVTASHNEIYNNIIKEFQAEEATSGIYVYFPALAPVDSSIRITNNKISDIQGDSYALGISVYYATSVLIANNQIFNVRGLVSEDISVISGDAKLVDNVFTPDAVEYSTATWFVSGMALVASLLYYHFSYTSIPTPVPLSVSFDKKRQEIEDEEDDEEEDEEEEEKAEELKLSEEERRKREEKGIYEKDGAEDEHLRLRKTVSWHIGSSPSLT